MSVSEVVTEESVYRAIAIHDDMGREAFWLTTDMGLQQDTC